MKNSVDELAVFGCKPAFCEKLHVGKPNIGDRERLLFLVNEMLDRRWLTNNGPFVQQFEEHIAKLVGVKHCVAMCNATIALEIAIRALGMVGEVIVPSFTFIATAHALQWQGITPVFCDVDPKTHNIDPTKIKALITPRTSGVIGVHVWGRACDVDSLENIAGEYHLKVIYDAAHAFGCSYKGQMIGNFGDAEVFSFHATKFINTFEGGAVVTNSDDLATKIRLMRNFGFRGYDDVCYIGTNGKMTEISAAMGLTSLESMQEFIDINYHNYCHYQEMLASLPGLRMIDYPEFERNNYQYVILEIDEQVAGISRDHLIEILHAENVLARRYFYPGCHELEPYRTYYPNARLLLPQTEILTRRVMSLPNGTSIGKMEVSEICQIIQLVLDNSEKIREKLN